MLQEGNWLLPPRYTKIHSIPVRADLLVAAHYRNDCIGNVDSIYEMLDIQSRIDKRFQISHLSSCSALGMMDESLELINDYIAKDSRLNYDTYPYNAFATHIGSTVFDDGCLEAWQKDYKDLLLTGRVSRR